jgi:hypothetical protein
MTPKTISATPITSNASEIALFMVILLCLVSTLVRAYSRFVRTRMSRINTTNASPLLG